MIDFRPVCFTVVPTSLDDYSLQIRETRSAETSDSLDSTVLSSSFSSSSNNQLLLGSDNNCPVYAKIGKCINYDQERTVCDWTVESQQCDGSSTNYTLFYTKGSSSNKGEVFTPYCVTQPSGVVGDNSELKINNSNNKQKNNDQQVRNMKNYRLIRPKISQNLPKMNNVRIKTTNFRQKLPKIRIKSPKTRPGAKKSSSGRKKLSSKSKKLSHARKNDYKSLFSKSIKPRSAVHDDYYYGTRKKRAALAIHRGLESSIRHRCTFRAEIGHVQHVFFVMQNPVNSRKVREPENDDLVFIVTGDENRKYKSYFIQITKVYLFRLRFLDC